MRGRIKDYLYISPTRGRLTIDIEGDFRKQYDKLKDAEVNISIDKYRAARSLDANALLWKMCFEIAKKIGSTKEEVYKDHIKQVGEYTPLPIRADAVESFKNIWSAHGTGWFAEVVDDSKLEGYKLVFAYHGSSVYDTAQMSRLLDDVIDSAKELGIDVISERELSLLKEQNK